MRRIREASSRRNVRRGLIAALLAIPVVFIATTMPMQAMGNPVSPATTGGAALTLGQTDEQDPVTVGDNVTYDVTVGVDPELSSGDAENVTLYDNISPDVDFVSADSDIGSEACSYDNEGTVTCNFGTMHPDESITAYITVQTTDNCTGGGTFTSFSLTEPCTITNEAEVYADNMTNNPNPSYEDTTVNPESSSALTLTKSDSPDPVQELNPVTYTLNVRNTDSETNANNVVVTDNLPPGTTFSSISTTKGSCSHTATQVTCNLGTLAPSGEGPGETVTIVVVAPNVTTDTTITNEASVSSSNAGTTDASADTLVVASNGSSTEGSVPPGSTQPYTFTTATVSQGGTPAVNAGDPTTVSLTVPPGGPGGSLTLDEIPCSSPPCTASAAQPAASVVLGNVVFDVEPPANYPHSKPFTVVLLYDKTLNPGPGPVYYFKEGVTPGEIRLKACGSPGPGGKPPCVVNQKRIRGGSALVKGDWRVVIKINSDPRMRK
jgi:uncharacterized repeat protein (TIGR01451 family)